ncbi:MAG: ribokinase [Flavobacteriaceae bacterium]|jgi:ribokinase
MEKKKIEFLSIGDILVDAFIKLSDAHVQENMKTQTKELCMRFGDKIPYDKVDVVKAVGNGPNASVSASRLGLTSASMSHVGNDDFGRECLETLKENNVSTDFVTIEEGKKTNYHYILSFQAERTILIKHEDFTYNLAEQIKNLETPSWIYFTSVGEDSMQYHSDIADWVQENNIKMAFQPGTYQISLGHEKLSDIYKASEVFFCNVQEAQKITENKTTNVQELLSIVHSYGPKIVCITDGTDGAYVYDSYTEKTYYMPIYPDPAPPVERTGAGDSFSSAFTSFLAKGMSVSEALMRAPINSMNVVQHVGAQKGLLSVEEIETWLEKAPEDYKIKEI